MMNRMTRLLPAFAVLIAGCGKDPASTCSPVSGEVQYDGKPAAGVHVFFMPSKGASVAGSPTNPHAITGPDGRFTLTTFAEGDGAPPGSYRVILIWRDESE